MPDAFCVTEPAAFSTSVPAAESEIPALIAMLLAAVNVKLLVEDQAIGLTTVILPTPVPLGLVVVTTTLELPNAGFRVVVNKSESCTAVDAAKVPVTSVFALVSVP